MASRGSSRAANAAHGRCRPESRAGRRRAATPVAPARSSGKWTSSPDNARPPTAGSGVPGCSRRRHRARPGYLVLRPGIGVVDGLDFLDLGQRLAAPRPISSQTRRWRVRSGIVATQSTRTNVAIAAVQMSVVSTPYNETRRTAKSAVQATAATPRTARALLSAAAAAGRMPGSSARHASSPGALGRPVCRSRSGGSGPAASLRRGSGTVRAPSPSRSGRGDAIVEAGSFHSGVEAGALEVVTIGFLLASSAVAAELALVVSRTSSGVCGVGHHEVAGQAHARRVRV